MLQGVELIDCAKANAKRGTAYAAKQSGYNKNISLFQKNLKQACQEIGVDINDITDLITDQQLAKENRKFLGISPKTSQEL
ncbi:MAG: hypothetical protein QNJ18_17855 [Xenococcaceae cyanobacterium MO_167.B52]|nr:hypothetical protein [Xenococcaceae cyanobacterium MO_167.B52]